MKKILLISILSQFFLGCGDGSTLPEPNSIAREELQLVAMEGSWQGCRANGANSFLTTLVADGQSVTTTIDFYNGVTNCSTSSSFQTVKSGNYTIGTEAQSVTGYNSQAVTAYNLNVTTTSFTMTANTAGVVAGWNGFSVCGKNDWVLGTTTSALNLINCDPSLGTNHPDEITNGTVSNLVNSPNSNTLVINVQVSSSGSVTTRPTDFTSVNPFTVSLTKN
jgi:hypothetical protein